MRQVDPDGPPWPPGKHQVGVLTVVERKAEGAEAEAEDAETEEFLRPSGTDPGDHARGPSAAARRELPMKRKTRADAVHRVTVSGLDRQAAESLYLELRRLSRKGGVELVRFVVREVGTKR